MRDKDAPTEKKEVEELSDVLFCEIQEAQGFFYVSDGETFATRAELFERLRGRVAWGKKAVKIMENFLRKHGELKL